MLITLFKAFGWFNLIYFVGYMIAAALGVASADRVWAYQPAVVVLFTASMIGIGFLCQVQQRSAALWQHLGAPRPSRADRPDAAETGSPGVRPGIGVSTEPVQHGPIEPHEQDPRDRTEPSLHGDPTKLAPTEWLLYGLAGLSISEGLIHVAAIALDLDSLALGTIELLFPDPYASAGGGFFAAAYFGLFGYACTLARRSWLRLELAGWASLDPAAAGLGAQDARSAGAPPQGWAPAQRGQTCRDGGVPRTVGGKGAAVLALLIVLFKALGWLFLVLALTLTVVAARGGAKAEEAWAFHPAGMMTLAATIIGIGHLWQTLHRSITLWRRPPGRRQQAMAGPERPGHSPGEATGAAAPARSLAQGEPEQRASARTKAADAYLPKAVTEKLLYALAVLGLSWGLLQVTAILLGLDSVRLGAIDLVDPNLFGAAGLGFLAAAYFGLFGCACTLARRTEARLAKAA